MPLYYRKTILYKLKALDSFLNGSLDTKLDIQLVWLSHKTVTGTSSTGKTQGFIKNLRNYFIGSVRKFFK